MREMPSPRSLCGHVAVGVVLLLAVAFGSCLINSDHSTADDQMMSAHLCAGMVMMSSSPPALLAGPLVSGRLPLDQIPAVYVVSLHLPDPPPKSLALS